MCTADREGLQALSERQQDANTAIDRKGIDEGGIHGEAFRGDAEPEA